MPGTSIEPIAFLLGCERSGSTWLANILDAHQGVELIMEPFAPYASLFPGFPPRHLHVVDESPALEESIRRGLRATLPKKYSLLYRPGRSARWRTVDATLVNMRHRLQKRICGKSPLSCLQWELLNLNHSEIPADLRVRKQRLPACFVVKELRLNLKVPVLIRAFPGARYLVIVRNPAAQLTSTRRWIAQGHLQELSTSLKTLAADVNESPGLRRYRAWLGDGDLDDVLVAWWFINYETLLADLRSRGAPVLFVRHEELAADPGAGTEQILTFLGLPASPSVAKYLKYSTAAEPHSTSPVDTFRRSAEHSTETIRGADPVLVAKLRRVAHELPCCDELRGYFTGC